VTGLLSNLESPLRPKKFVTSKTIQALQDIKSKVLGKLDLENINISRGWGSAPD
jgi:GDPmannose 4,6-dehydratase